MEKSYFQPYIEDNDNNCPLTSPQFSILKLLTNRINSTYRKIKTGADKASLENINESHPVLTTPDTPMKNYGLDNLNYELIVRKGDILGTSTSLEGRTYSMNSEKVSHYEIVEKLGNGTFGQVFKCIDLNTNKEVAIKILKNKKAYFRQGLLEITALQTLNKFYDKNKNIVDIYVL